MKLLYTYKYKEGFFGSETIRCGYENNMKRFNNIWLFFSPFVGRCSHFFSKYFCF